jgi:hypothetical protein
MKLYLNILLNPRWRCELVLKEIFYYIICSQDIVCIFISLHMCYLLALFYRPLFLPSLVNWSGIAREESCVTVLQTQYHYQ